MTARWDIGPALPERAKPALGQPAAPARTPRKPARFKLKAPPPPREHDWQQVAYEGLERLLPADAEVFSVDHAGKHGRIITRIVGGKVKRVSLEQVRKRRRGCKAGICDMWVFWGGICVPIECKRDDAASRPTDDQIAHHVRMTKAGFPPVLCRTPEEVYAAVRARGIPLRGVF